MLHVYVICVMNTPEKGMLFNCIFQTKETGVLSSRGLKNVLLIR